MKIARRRVCAGPRCRARSPWTTTSLVDLSGLSFADASLMVDLAMVARRLRKAGRGMRMCGAAPHIHTLIELVGLHRLPGVQVDGSAPAPAW